MVKHRKGTNAGRTSSELNLLSSRNKPLRVYFALFFIYFSIAIILLPRSPFLKKTGLSPRELRVLFAIKIAAGCLLGWANGVLYGNTTDYDGMNNFGIAEHQLLLNDPVKFFSDIFQSGYGNFKGFFGTDRSYWNNLPENLIIKILAIFNFLSRGNYFINALFFNVIFFFGHAALFKIFSSILPQRKYIIAATCFLLPSLLYYSSGVHKDGIIFTALCCFCFALFMTLRTGPTKKRISLLVFSFISILLFRNFVTVILLPFALIWIIDFRKIFKPAILWFGAAATALVICLILHFASPYSPFAAIANRQAAFLSLPKGRTQYDMEALTPGPGGMLKEFPGAFRRGFASPAPGEFDNIFLTGLSIEISLILTAMIAAIGWYRRDLFGNPFFRFSLAFAFTLILFAAYITPSAGALVRYRSIYLPFLLLPALTVVKFPKK